MPYPYVPRVHLNADDSVTLDVALTGFDEGKSAEISGYVIQNGNAFPFYAVQKVTAPDPATGASQVTVTLPPMKELVLGQDVTVITRVTEVLIWPTVLGYGSDPGPGFKAIWLAKSYSDSPTASATDQGSSQPDAYGASGGTSAGPPTEAPPPSDCPAPVSFTVGGVRITVEAAAPGGPDT